MSKIKVYKMQASANNYNQIIQSAIYYGQLHPCQLYTYMGINEKTQQVLVRKKKNCLCTFPKLSVTQTTVLDRVIRCNTSALDVGCVGILTTYLTPEDRNTLSSTNSFCKCVSNSVARVCNLQD